MIEVEYEVTIPAPATAEDLKVVTEKISAACDTNHNTRIKIKWTEPQTCDKLFFKNNIENGI